MIIRLPTAVNDNGPIANLRRSAVLRITCAIRYYGSERSNRTFTTIQITRDTIWRFGRRRMTTCRCRATRRYNGSMSGSFSTVIYRQVLKKYCSLRINDYRLSVLRARIYFNGTSCLSTVVIFNGTCNAFFPLSLDTCK